MTANLRRRQIIESMLVAVAYAAAAQLGLIWASHGGLVTAVWPPTGIAVALLLLRGRKVLPGIYLGAVGANLLVGAPPHLALMLGVGNTLAPFAGYEICRRFDVRPALERLRDVVGLALGAGMFAMTISATLGSFFVTTFRGGNFLEIWKVWWVGDALGVILVAPLILTFGAMPLRRNRVVEKARDAVLMLTLLAVTTYYAVTSESATGYVVIPIALWVAIHLEQPGAALATVIMSVLDIWGVVSDPAPGVSADARLITIQAVNATLSLMLLAMGASMNERRRAQTELRTAAEELEDRVHSRTAALVQINERLESEIEDRMLTESALRSSEHQLAEAQRLAHIGSYQWDARNGRTSWSEEMFRIYGLEPGSVAPTPEECLAFVRPDMREDMQRAVEQTVAEGGVLSREYPMLLRDGTHKWVHIFTEVVKDRDGELVGLRGTCQDISARKRAENELRWSEQRFRTLLESAPDAVVVVDPQGTIVLMNDQTAQLFGYEPGELLGQSVDVLVPEAMRQAHGQDRRRYAAQPARRPMGQGRDLYGVRKDGSEVAIDISLSPVETENGFLVFALVRDASERRQGEEALRQALQREVDAAEHLRKLDQAKNAFLSAVSHELRTPLTAILGFSELLQEPQVRQSETMTTDLVDRLQSSATRLNTLLQDLLDIDRLHRGILEPRRRATSLRNLIDTSLDNLELGEHKLAVELEDAIVVVDPAQTERIVENLITNAVKYTPAGTTITVRAAGSDDRGVTIVVEDEGPGIPEEYRETIFEPFVRATKGTFTQGTGIGLALVDRFAKLHGGGAWVDERPGGGARFHVHLAGPPSERSAVA